VKVEPAGADGDEDAPDSGVVLPPGPGGQAVVPGQVVGDDADVTSGIGCFNPGESWWKALLREEAVMVTSCPSRTRGVP
jgi:hypothetical protein